MPIHVTNALAHQMSAEQLGQLYELMNATKNVYNPQARPENDTTDYPKPS